MLNKIYKMLDRYEYPVMADDEIKMGNISIYIDSKGRLVLHQSGGNTVREIFLEIEGMDDMTIGAEIVGCLLKHFDWEM